MNLQQKCPKAKWIGSFKIHLEMKELRGGIIRLFEEGKNANQIATAMNFHRKTVGRIIHRYQETGSYEDRHRSGSDGLQHLEHFRSGSVLKAPPVDRSAEEEFGGSVKQNPTRCH
uniref:Transposase n=1 Tax=Acrobeloides nanus TaxID=290746 RepID=A0A914DFW3_9BILA